MSTERDSFLTEAMGLCWHELNSLYTRPHCIKCGKNEFDNPNFNLENYKYNFSTWEGFGILWEFAIKQDWFINFYEDHMYGAVDRKYKPTVHILRFFINPDGFANRIYEFLKEMSCRKQ